MNEIDIIQQIKSGEVSKMQFKERLLDSYDIGCELVAFSNARGGTLVVGVKDKTGSLNPLSYLEVQETTNTLSNIASENVVPAILVDVETISVDGGSLVVAHIKEGVNKPYHDNRGIVWVKNGADKRKVFDNVELAECVGSNERLSYNNFKCFQTEEIINIPIIYSNFAGTRNYSYSCNRAFSSACTVELCISHFKYPPYLIIPVYISGFCAAWLCSLPL